MPSKKKKYNARFPAGRIKKIMQSDEEIGKVAQAVPVIISRTLELFVESLLTKTLKITNSRNAKTLSTSHMKQCIMSENRFDFLRELVRNIPDISVAEEAANYNEEDNQSSPEENYPDSDTPYDLSMPSTSNRIARLNYSMSASSSTSSNGHNGGGAAAAAAAGEINESQRNYALKRSVSANNSSVIKHTTTASIAAATAAGSSDRELPIKLSRCDSTPASHLQKTTIQHHPRLKHQSYSMPSNDFSANSNKPKIPPKQMPSQQTAAIPAPIVSIDVCNKPIVKIDYSNLPLSHDGALSAPADMSTMCGNNTAFNFSVDPIINIDLSNIVTNTSTTNPPPIATINIGNMSTAVQSVAVQSPSNSKTNSQCLTATKAKTATTHSTYLDLDEDYDNI